MERIPDRRTIAKEVLARKIKMKKGGHAQRVTLEQAVIMKLKQIAVEGGDPWALKLIEKIMGAARERQLDSAHKIGGRP